MTDIQISPGAFTLTCPHCGAVIESIAIHREYERELQCFDCLGEFTLNLSLDP